MNKGVYAYEDKVCVAEKKVRDMAKSFERVENLSDEIASMGEKVKKSTRSSSLKRRLSSRKLLSIRIHSRTWPWRSKNLVSRWRESFVSLVFPLLRLTSWGDRSLSWRKQTGLSQKVWFMPSPNRQGERSCRPTSSQRSVDQGESISLTNWLYLWTRITMSKYNSSTKEDSVLACKVESDLD